MVHYYIYSRFSCRILVGVYTSTCSYVHIRESENEAREHFSSTSNHLRPDACRTQSDFDTRQLKPRFPSAVSRRALFVALCVYTQPVVYDRNVCVVYVCVFYGFRYQGANPSTTNTVKNRYGRIVELEK